MRLSKIHDIKPHTNKPRASSSAYSEVTSKPIRTQYVYQKTHHRPHRHNGKGIWYIAGVLIIGLVFGFSIFFAEASVDIKPKSQEVSVNEQISAFKKPVVSGLRFDSMIVSGEESVSLVSDTKQTVEEKALGRVRVYNEDPSGQSQALRVDTRLIDEQGFIYKTKERIVVPGTREVNGEKKIGSVEVDIYADVAGVDGNRDDVGIRLGIAGFKESGSDKFNTIYAETITPLSGGFVGERFVVEEGKKEAEVQALTAKLQESLQTQALAQIPETVTIPKNLMTLFDVKTTSTNSEDGSVILKVSGSLFSVLFNEVELEHYIIENILVDISPEDVRIVNIDTLSLSYIDQALQTINPSQLENLLLTLVDTLHIEFVVNTDALAFDLVGKKRRDFNTVVSNHSGISSAVLSLTPFWKNRLPERDEDIEIIVDSAL